MLPPRIAADVAAGRPVLPLTAVDLAGLSAGDLVHLADPANAILVTAVADPENGVARVLARGHVDSLSPQLLADRIRSAAELRRSLGLPCAGTTAYRLLNAEGDQLSGFTADVLGEYAVVHAYSHGLLDLGCRIGQAILEELPLRGVVVKVRPGGPCRPGRIVERTVGDPAPSPLIVEEGGIPYATHPVGSLNVGLFTDMREHRRRLGRSTGERNVLNLFAYTGSLSIVAARHGAASVTSVDRSAGVLAWAQQNFRLSGLDPDDRRFRFEVADAPRFVRQALARAEEYDLVLLDPPAVSAARPSSWSLKNDYSDLISQCAGLLPRAGGELWVTSNARGDRPLLEHVEAGMNLSRRSYAVLSAGGLPPDYPVLDTYPEGRYLEVLHLAAR